MHLGGNMLKKLKIKIIDEFDTQTEFARKCGRSDNWVSRIITERQKPTDKEKKIIAQELKIEDVESYLQGNI